MMRLLVFSTILFICGKSIDNSELSDGSNLFGYDLCDELYTDSTTNIWISPFCITSCFALIYPGSNGNTQTQIANVLNYPSTDNTAQVTQQFFTLQSLIENTYNGIKTNEYDNKPSIIGIANKIYSSKTLILKQPYIDALNDGKQSFIDYNFDFFAQNATKIINNWVNQNTNGLIKDILQEGQDISSWRLVAMNAIFLNGTFKSQFETTMTSLNKFYTNTLRTESTSDCHLMHQIDYFEYYSNSNYQFLKFPFSDNNDLFILYALPINNDLSSNKNALITDENIIKTAINNLESKYIALALPKLSIEATYILNNPLQDLGMKDAFNSAADFSGMSDENLLISTVIHKTMVEMDEKGLLAAAVTLIVMAGSAYIETTRPKPILFKADNPYQMYIIDGEHDNTILFMGQINNPGIVDGSDTPIYDESNDPIWTDYSSINVHNNPKKDALNMESLIVVIASVCVVVIGVIIWFIWGNRGKKEIYIEKVSTKNFVELKENNNNNNQGNGDDEIIAGKVEVTKDDEVELGDSLQNTLR